MIAPKKLKKGDHIRIIAPSRSMGFLADGVKEQAERRLREYGFLISFGNHINEIDEFSSSSVEARIADIHAAYLDKNVHAILTAIGGYNSGQLLKKLDYALIGSNPKILCGFSDTTCIQNAITEKTGVITYYGPHFSSWGMKKGFEYSLEYFLQCCVDDDTFTLQSSEQWSDDAWYLNQNDRKLIKNEGYWVLNRGVARGRLIGGNLDSLSVLKGTEYFPNLKNSILFIEETAKSNPEKFDRKLQSILLLDNFHMVKGLLIGRFQKESHMSQELLRNVIKTKPELQNIPIMANIDFGHTTPIATLPIGGSVEIRAIDIKPKISIIKH